MSFKSLRYTIVFFSLIFYSLSAQPGIDKKKAPSTTLHLIILADTLDAYIGASVKKDVENVLKEARNISLYTGMNLKTTLIDGVKANHFYMSRVFKKLKFGANDTVFFYFSGHGYRSEDKGNNPWPNLNFATYKFTGIDFALVVEQLIRKKPRFILAIADSCNNVIDEDESIITYKKLKKPKVYLEHTKKQNYQRLFLLSRGLVMASAAAPGEYGISLSRGGMYTLSFLASLSKEISQPHDEASWDVLMQRTLETAVRTSSFTYEIDGKIERYTIAMPPSSQWLYVEDILNIPAALKAIGR